MEISYETRKIFSRSDTIYPCPVCQLKKDRNSHEKRATRFVKKFFDLEWDHKKLLLRFEAQKLILDELKKGDTK